MSTFVLDTPLRNWRGHTESFAAYRKRLRKMHEIARQHLKGKLVFESSRPVVLPLRAVDLAVDEQIEQGKLRDVRFMHSPAGLVWPFGPRVQAPPKQFRVGRTKGVTYVKPKEQK